MPGDFSRRSVNKPAGYAGVLMQQGRVQLDSDWNEQLALANHRLSAETIDVVGCCGTPEGSTGFKIEPTPAQDDFFILPGRYYAGGLMAEIDPEWVAAAFSGASTQPGVQSTWLDGRPLLSGQWVELRSSSVAKPLRSRIVAVAGDGTLTLNPTPTAFQGLSDVQLRRVYTYLTQPFYPWPDPAPGFDSPPVGPLTSPAGGSGELILEGGEYLAYLEVWHREVDALEDPHLREVALGGPDTAERVQTVWQVKVLRTANTVGSPPSDSLCPQSDPQEQVEFNDLIAAVTTTAQLNARAVPPTPDTDPCILPPSAGFQGLENQLYRVEIFFGSGDAGGPTFVWSRDNATVETSILSADPNNPNIITVTDLGKDDLHSFGVGDWVEVVDRDGELQDAPRFLAQIVTPAPDPSTNDITLNTPVPSANAINNPGRNVFRLRRWDMTGSGVTSNGIAVTPGWTPIEAGVQVNFGPGYYAPHAYWLIPARTTTADVEWPPFQVPNTEPIPQPPVGVYRKFCQLAQISVVYESWNVTDVRAQFASLTSLTSGEATLRFHKKHLHGTGVVCGLEVQCAGDGNNVIVNNGYAIDCEGSDVVFCEPETFDVIAEVQSPSGPVDGDYSLYIDTGSGNELKLEPYSAAGDRFSDIFKNTIWVDFWNQYLAPFKGLWDQYKSQPQGDPVSNADRAFSALINLFNQLINASGGNAVYIAHDEHNRLVQIYNDIKGLLKDKAFCALLSNLRPVPAYPAAIDTFGTGYGKGFRTRLRLNPVRNIAITIGNDNTLHVYTLSGSVPVLTNIVTFPGAANLKVMDVAFSRDNHSLFAIANDGTNSTFASVPLASIANSSAWTTVSVPGVVLRSLVVIAAGIYATGAARGVYVVTPANNTFTVSLYFQCNATGQLVGVDENSLFLAASSNQSTVDQFNQVLRVSGGAAHGQANATTYTLPSNLVGSADDDLAVTPSSPAAHQSQRIYTTAGPSGAKTLVVNYATGALTDPGAWAQLSLANNDGVRFAFHPTFNGMLMSFGTTNYIALIGEVPAPPGGPPTPTLSFSTVYPAEVTPASLVTADQQKTLLALNAVSNTITAFPYGTNAYTSSQLNALTQYRVEMLDAWADLFLAFLQYLKDGFCDLLILKCRTCRTDSDPIYLAGITVRNGTVYKVCNFSKRRYVKTFPGVEYWLSIVPVLPIVEFAVKS